MAESLLYDALWLFSVSSRLILQQETIENSLQRASFQWRTILQHYQFPCFASSDSDSLNSDICYPVISAFFILYLH